MGDEAGPERRCRGQTALNCDGAQTEWGSGPEIATSPPRAPGQATVQFASCCKAGEAPPTFFGGG